MSDPRITCELLDRSSLAVKAILDESRGRQWQEVLNDTGNGKLTLQNDDPDLALVEYGDYVRFSIDGTARFAIVVESMERTDITSGEEADEVTVISGRGAVAVLEDVVIYPDAIFVDGVPFADARVFNFASLLADGPDPWVSAYDFGDRPTAGPYAGMPADFPPVTSRWAGPQAPDGSGDNPLGDWYYVAIVTGTPAARYRLFFGFDDAIEIWIDNVPIFSNEEATIAVTKSVDVFLDAAIHFFAFKITNKTFTAGTNPSGLTAALCTLNPDDSVDGLYWNVDASDPNQLAMPYPARAPGYTPGGLIKKLMLEATGLPGRSVPSLELVTATFDEDVDTNGDAWTEYISPSANIGTDLLSFLKQIAESSFDFWFDPATWELNLYQSRGSVTGVTYIEAENITDLKHSGTF